MKNLLFAFSLLFSLISYSQRPDGGSGNGGNPKKEEAKCEIFGTIIDSLTEEKMAYATVLAFKMPEEKMIKGAVTTENGSFSIAELPYGLYKIKISFVGYNVQYIDNIKLDIENSTFQVKDLKLGPTTLNTVEIIGDKPMISYEIDKKVINVADQINTDGQSATEVLQNIPSVTVAADGTVSLRGSSGFTLLINGIPTAMDASDALATIPASTIQDIEIITNPSAKFDAEGTSGIINIITKKSKLKGTSALINLSTGRFNNHNGDFSLNIKKNNWTFDLSGSAGNRNHPNKETSTRISTYDSLINRLESAGESSWKRNYYGGGGGIQWNPNNSHLLSVQADVKSVRMRPYDSDVFNSYDNDSLISTFSTDQLNHIDMFSLSSNLFYQYNIKRNKDHYISFKAIANLRDVVQSDTTSSYDTEGNLVAGNLYTETGPSNSYRFNIDYRLPIGKNHKFETGAQAQFGQSGDIGKNYVYNLSTQVYDYNDLFSSDVDYVRDIHAAYLIFGGKYKNLGYQGGLRSEYTYRTITSSKAVDFATIKRLDFFPSAHVSYSFKNKSQIIASYARRIERPRSWYFEPFITWQSPYSLRTGNPNLTPEYIDAFEVNFVKPIKKTGFFSVDTYFRKSKDIVDWISSVYEPGILINQAYNIGTSTSYGGEVSFVFDITKWWKTNIGANAYYYGLTGELNDIDYSRESFNWGSRVTNTFTVKGWMFQTVSGYRSGTVQAQGYSLGAFTQDVAIKKSFFKKRLAFTLQGRNILGTDRRESFSTTEYVDIHTINIPLAPQIQFSVAIKLNNYQKVYDRESEMDDF